MQYHYSFNRHRANLQACCESYGALDFDNWFWVKTLYLKFDGFFPMALMLYIIAKLPVLLRVSGGSRNPLHKVDESLTNPTLSSCYDMELPPCCCGCSMTYM